jgi:phosphoribosylanthranilate isomerase
MRLLRREEHPPRNDDKVIMTKIKICGIKTLHDALNAIKAGADYLGFNFYPKSPRYIEKNVCGEITSVLKKEYPQIKLIGVFVNSPVSEIKDILRACSLDLAQLHGDETFEILNQLNGKAFKAFRGEIDEMLISNNEPAFLLDAQVKDAYGGTGMKADWNVAGELAKQYKFLLAGGLTPENVVEAVSRVKPWGVDVASGVESSPGVKDEAKMSAFIKAVRENP